VATPAACRAKSRFVTDRRTQKIHRRRRAIATHLPKSNDAAETQYSGPNFLRNSSKPVLSPPLAVPAKPSVFSRIAMEGAARRT
jgi:hypothetical protein